MLVVQLSRARTSIAWVHADGVPEGLNADLPALDVGSHLGFCLVPLGPLPGMILIH